MAQELFALLPSNSGLSVQLLLVGTLDRETEDLYSFRIFATDRGVPPLIGEARIYIIVTVSHSRASLYAAYICVILMCVCVWGEGFYYSG